MFMRKFRIKTKGLIENWEGSAVFTFKKKKKTATAVRNIINKRHTKGCI